MRKSQIGAIGRGFTKRFLPGAELSAVSCHLSEQRRQAPVTAREHGLNVAPVMTFRANVYSCLARRLRMNSIVFAQLRFRPCH